MSLILGSKLTELKVIVGPWRRFTVLVPISIVYMHGRSIDE